MLVLFLQPLNGSLPLHGFLLCLKFLQIHQLHRSPAPGIFCPMPFIVGFQPFLNVVGPSGIQRPVTAF